MKNITTKPGASTHLCKWRYNHIVTMTEKKTKSVVLTLDVGLQYSFRSVGCEGVEDGHHIRFVSMSLICSIIKCLLHTSATS